MGEKEFLQLHITFFKTELFILHLFNSFNTSQLYMHILHCKLSVDLHFDNMLGKRNTISKCKALILSYCVRQVDLQHLRYNIVTKAMQRSKYHGHTRM